MSDYFRGKPVGKLEDGTFKDPRGTTIELGQTVMAIVGKPTELMEGKVIKIAKTKINCQGRSIAGWFFPNQILVIDTEDEDKRKH